MIKKLLSVSKRIGTLKSALLFFGVYLVLYLLLFTPVTPVGAFFLRDIPGLEAILDLKFGYSAAEGRLALEMLGETGRASFSFNLLTIDVLVPLAMLAAFVSVLRFLLSKIGKAGENLTLFALFPFVGTLFDFVENIWEVVMIAAYPGISDGMFSVGSFLTTVKWVVMNISSMAVVVLIVWAAVYNIYLFVKGRKAATEGQV